MKLLTGLWTALTIAMSVGNAAEAAARSSITSIEITDSRPAGTFNGVAFRRIQGVIHGVVSVDEPIAGLREVAAARDIVAYDSRFEMTAPEDPSRAAAIVVEAANRGSAPLQGMMNPPGGAQAGDGFLFNQGLSIALIQWQAGLAGVPQGAQGVGEAIVRDFGRLLGGAFPSARAGLPVFRHRILAGVSQSGWMVNSVIAEGFNVDPDSGRGVYQGAFTRNGGGVVLAINGFAHGKPQFPYASPNDPPLTPVQLLSRPKSDPVMVDVASLTDFYRLRASVFARARSGARLHRYATAAPHAPGAMPAAVVFGTLKCNGGQAVPLNPTSDALYLRPLLLGLAKAIGVATPSQRRLPPDAPFDLEPAPPALKEIARLPGVPLWTPAIAANGAAAGGVAMIEAILPLGVADPPALPPVGLASISDICGNFSGWKAFSAGELERRYGSRADYLRRARSQAARLVRQGYLLKQDEAAAVAQVEALLPAAFE